METTPGPTVGIPAQDRGPGAGERRLAALRRTKLLDSSPDEAFERLTRLAARILRAPVALVSLVDADRQFFKSAVGLAEPWASARQTPLSHSFCQYAVAAREPLIIADARRHPLVQDNPAIADLGVVAYAGIPLFTFAGEAIGTFCVIDHQPRDWTADEIATLTDLAAAVTTEIELRTVAAERAYLLMQAEAARAEAEGERRRFGDLFQQAPAAIALLSGPAHIFRLANPAYEQVSGRNGDALIGRSVRDAFPELADQGFYELLDAVYSSGAPYVGTGVPIRIDRHGQGVLEDTYFTFAYQPMHAADGAVEGILVHAVEVTGQVRAQQETETLTRRLAAERDRLQQILDVLPESVMIVDLGGQWVLNNAAACGLLGINMAARGLTVTDAGMNAAYTTRYLDGTPCPPEDLPITRSARRGIEVRGEQLVMHNPVTGRDVPLLINSAPLRDESGAVIGALAVFQDISALKDLDRQKDEFLATVAHDLKNPLTAIGGMAQLLARRAARVADPDGDRIRQGLATIGQTVAQMALQITELLDLTRLRMGRPLDLDLAPADLVEQVRQVARAYQQTTEGHVVRMESDSAAISAVCDQSRLRRALGNIVANAIKYSPDGGEILVSVRREQEDAGGWAVISVRDQGLGIPEPEMARVFERFYRASNVSGAIAGTGLGLTGVRQIVEHHGGTVRVTRNEDCGITLTLRLPLAGPLPATPAQPAKS